MATVVDLGQKVKAKYPGSYDNLSDEEVGIKTRSKYPDAYGSFTDVTPAPQEDGFLKSTAKAILQTPIQMGVSAFNAAKAVKPLAGAISSHITGNQQAEQSYLSQANAERDKSRTLPFFGTEKPFVTGTESNTEAAKKVLGAGAELGSYTIGGGAGKALLTGGLKGLGARLVIGAGEGVVAGALGSGGRTAAEGGSASDIGSSTVSGAEFGGVLGGLIGATPAAVKGIKTLGKFGLTKATGLEQSTLNTALEHGAELSKARAEGLNRSQIGEKVKGAFDNLIGNISDTGKAYDPIREAGHVIEIPEGYWTSKLADNGIVLNAEGAVDRKLSRRVLTQADASAINDFTQNYAKEGIQTADDFLRSREALANVAKYDAAKSGESANIAKNVRSSLNEDFRGHIPGLEELDAQYSPLKDLLKETKSIVDKGGEVKLAKIVNSLKSGREGQLATLEKLHPGITNELQMLSAVEDIEAASGHKVGTYAQNLLLGGGTAALATGNPLVGIGAAIASNPKVIIPILETFSKLKGAALGKLGGIGNISALVTSASEKIKNGIKPNAEESKVVAQAFKAANDNPKAYGFVAGFQPEQDENGNFKGIKFDPKMAALGVGLGVAGEEIGGKLKGKLESGLQEGELGAKPRVIEGEIVKPLADVLKKSPNADPLIEEAKKYKTPEEFVNKADITKTDSFKKWAGKSDVVEVFHGSPHNFDKFEPGEKTFNVSGQPTSGISFADKYSNAEPFSRQYSENYTNDYSFLSKKYDDLLKKEKSNISVDEKTISKLQAELKTIFNGNNLNVDGKMSSDEANAIISYFGNRELKNLSPENYRTLEQIANGNKENLGKIFKMREEEIAQLDKKYKDEGKVYRAYLKGKVVEVNGEDIGFGATRNEIVDNLKPNEILKINNADAGQYIGTEYMTKNPKNIFVVNAGETKSQLTDIWNQANKKSLGEVLQPKAKVQPRTEMSFDELPRTVKEDISSEIYDATQPEHDFSARFGPEDIQNALNDHKISIGNENVDALIAQFKGQNRSTSEIAVKNLKQVLQRKGELDPIIVNGNKLVDGGHRIMAYKELGKKEIPVIDISSIYEMLKTNPESILDPYEYGLKNFNQPK